MAKKKDDLKDGTIIDLDADQVIEHVDAPRAEEPIPTIAEEPFKPVAKPAARRGWIIPAAALLAGAIGGGWFYKDVLASYFPSDQTRALTDKLDVLEKSDAAQREQLATLDRLSSQVASDVDALENKETAHSSVLTDVQAAQVGANDRVASLEQSIADVKKAVSDLAARPVVQGSGADDVTALAALQTRIDMLEKDVAALKAKPAEAPDNTAMLSQSLSDLRAKVAAGVGYENELSRIQRMVPAAEGLDVLQQHVAGVPDAKGLAAELVTLASTLPKPAAPAEPQADDSWWGTITDSLSDVITIRSTGEPDWPATALAVAATAESGDLAKAIEALGAVDGAKPAGLQQWQERAQARLNIDAAIQSVEDAVLRVVAAKAQ
jgi:hypothetical protein